MLPIPRVTSFDSWPIKATCLHVQNMLHKQWWELGLRSPQQLRWWWWWWGCINNSSTGGFLKNLPLLLAGVGGCVLCWGTFRPLRNNPAPPSCPAIHTTCSALLPSGLPSPSLRLWIALKSPALQTFLSLAPSHWPPTNLAPPRVQAHWAPMPTCSPRDCKLSDSASSKPDAIHPANSSFRRKIQLFLSTSFLWYKHGLRNKLLNSNKIVCLIDLQFTLSPSSLWNLILQVLQFHLVQCNEFWVSG